MSVSDGTFNRRRFLQISVGSAAAMALGQLAHGADPPQGPRPNFLWISTEDISPDLGCYGDPYAVTPNIDKLAAEGTRYTNAFAHAGVCAPARSGIITGMYPTTIGTHHMRCKGVPPAYVKCFTEYLRAAGYYCTNNVKTDYQFDSPLTAWDQCSRQAHWRNRPAGMPFFAVFNITTTHESQIRNHSESMRKRLASLAPHEKHDPAKAKLPPYYPDTPIVRRDWAQYYDIITLMDKQVAEILRQLAEDGLAEDTIVWFWGDHGRGLPRAKRWIYDSGIHVPLIIRIPPKFRKLARPDDPDAVGPGTVNDELVSFIDFAPTMLSLAQVPIPKHIQGRAFLGPQRAEPRQYIFAARDRMDEAYDLIRAVRDKRFKYIRNYMPHVTRGQDIEYMNQMPTMQQMRQLNAEGKLKGPQRQYFEPTKPVEELYDTWTDPHEVNNLASDPKYRHVLLRMRKVHKEWVKRTGDVGLIPEPQFDEMKRPGGRWKKTAEPLFFADELADGREAQLTIMCPTPGTSIAYRIDSANKKGRWQLYTKPIRLKSGQVLYAKACRLGYKDSREVRFRLGDKSASPVALLSMDREPHWREKLDHSDLLARLAALKDLDYAGNEAIEPLLQALGDEYASVRYWAVVDLHRRCPQAGRNKQLEAAIEKMLQDPAPVVRIAAAHAMCDWGRQDKALPVLVEALKSPTDKARLHAIIALKKIGEKARPALPQIKPLLKDPDRYVQRVTRAVLKQLGA